MNIFYDFSLQGYSKINYIHDPVDWALIMQIDKAGLWRICYEEDPFLSDSKMSCRMHDRLKTLLPGSPTPDQYRIDEFKSYQVDQRRAEKFRKGRVILAGDAACLTNPIGGLGLSGGVIEAEQLGAALVAVINDENAVDEIDEHVLRQENVFLDFTSARASPYFTSMKEAGPVQRARELAFLEKAGSDKAAMREFLLHFDRLNGRRSSSLTTHLDAIKLAVRRALYHTVNTSARLRQVTWYHVKNACEKFISIVPSG